MPSVGGVPRAEPFLCLGSAVKGWGNRADMQVTGVSVLAKTLFGGALVLALAALSEALNRSGSRASWRAAPSVAIAGLVVGSLAKGPLEQAPAARTMIAGSGRIDGLRGGARAGGRRWGPGAGVDGRVCRVDRRRARGLPHGGA